jgi:hypothetical protein
MNTYRDNSTYNQNKTSQPKFYRKNQHVNSIPILSTVPVNTPIYGTNCNNSSIINSRYITKNASVQTSVPIQKYLPIHTPTQSPIQSPVLIPTKSPIIISPYTIDSNSNQGKKQDENINNLFSNIISNASSIKHVNDVSNGNVNTYRIALNPTESLKFMEALNKDNKTDMNVINKLYNNCCEEKVAESDILNIYKILTEQVNHENIETKNIIDDYKKYDKQNKEYIEIDVKCKSLTDLIELGKQYDPKKKDIYAFDYEKLNKIVEPLEELNSVIGMDSVKTSIVNQIMYFLLELEPVKDMLHTVIQGPPGVGKTMLGQILSKIYHKMGIIEGCDPNNMKFKIYKRTDFIGQYLGQTAIKTQKAIDESMGGVMFIDEAYSLGSSQSGEKSDIYSKECLDTLMQNLSERAGKFVVIIAGYADELNKHFFSSNEGLRRRFTFKYSIDKYDHNELMRIFDIKVASSNWKINNNLDDKTKGEFIKKHYNEFTHFAGDIETFLFHVKVAHGNRIFGKIPDERKKINMDDITNGFESFKRCKNENKSVLSPAVLAMFN